MSKKVVAVTLGLVLAVSVSACNRKEEQPVPKTSAEVPMSMPMQQSPMQPMSPQGGIDRSEKQVVVPVNVKGKWNKVKLVFMDKASKKSSEYIVNIGSELKVPNTNLKIVVGEFLPDFKMTETEITSASDVPNNPALRVEVFEDGRSIFKGWLYAKFPTIHPFEHEKYGLILKEGMKG